MLVSRVGWPCFGSARRPRIVRPGEGPDRRGRRWRRGDFIDRSVRARPRTGRSRGNFDVGRYRCASRASCGWGRWHRQDQPDRRVGGDGSRPWFPLSRGSLSRHQQRGASASGAGGAAPSRCRAYHRRLRAGDPAIGRFPAQRRPGSRALAGLARRRPVPDGGGAGIGVSAGVRARGHALGPPLHSGLRSGFVAHHEGHCLSRAHLPQRRAHPATSVPAGAGRDRSQPGRATD